VVRIFEGEKLVVLLEDGIVMLADRVVLALGNAAPAQPFEVDPQMRHYVADPWQPERIEALPEEPVTLIGSGLTAVDVALTLARSGKHSKITALSRHGLLPLPHAATVKIEIEKPRSRTLSGLLRELRAYPGDWRSLMDAMRPHWNDLWSGMSRLDQERFLRHVARYWEIHRHRMAPSVAAELAELSAEGVFEVRRQTIRRVPAGDHGVVNCTGPGSLVRTDPLVRSLVADGLAQAGPHGLGIDADEHGTARRPGDRTSHIFVLGSVRKGVLWETTAAPEIRQQARALARHLQGVSLCG
jgi:uncharacterized NAD(P)/FAD-binding protein YdhS